MAVFLVVDDLDVKRRWMRELLETAGHAVAEAADGSQALDKVRVQSFDIIVTDINMPEMNGLELIRRLRSEAASELKILAISAGTGEFPADPGLQAGAAMGADGILYMPCRPAEFLEAIDALCIR